MRLDFQKKKKFSLEIGTLHIEFLVANNVGLVTGAHLVNAMFFIKQEPRGSSHGLEEKLDLFGDN